MSTIHRIDDETRRYTRIPFTSCCPFWLLLAAQVLAVRQENNDLQSMGSNAYPNFITKPEEPRVYIK